MMQRAIFAMLAVLALAIAPAHAQTGLLDVNKAAENQLSTLPGMTPAIVKSVVEERRSRPSSSSTSSCRPEAPQDQAPRVLSPGVRADQSGTRARRGILLIPASVRACRPN